jgi:hypothetical protein
MTRFWEFICLAIFVPLAGLFLVARGARRWQQLSALRTPIMALYMAWMVVILWAICCRPQLEQGRVTMRSLLALIAMEALLFTAIQIMRPPWYQW